MLDQSKILLLFSLTFDTHEWPVLHHSRIHGGLERSVVNTVAPSSRCAPCKTLHCYALDPLFYMHWKPMDVKKELDHFCSCNFWQHKVIGTMPKSDPYNKYNSSLKICCSCWVYYCACVDASTCVHIDLISCLTRYEQWVDDQLPECCSKNGLHRTTTLYSLVSIQRKK